MTYLSIIIPTYNGAEGLRACLEALCHQTQPATDFEVIVVMHGATDCTSSMLADLATPYRLNVIQQRHSGCGAAFNRGVATTAGPYCLFLGDHVIADPRLVAEHLRVQQERDGVIGLGQITLTLPKRANGFARYIAQYRRDHYACWEQGLQTPSCMDCYSDNLSVPRETFLQVGGFAVDLPPGYDIELGYRLERGGLSFTYIPDAIGHQDYHKGFHEIASDIGKVGSASMEIYKRHASMMSYREPEASSQISLRAIFLRRLLLAIGGPIRPLALVGLLLGKRAWAREWYRFLYDYCYWHGVRRAVPDRHTWKRLIRGTVILVYHACGGQGASPHRFVVPAARFARQMAWLKWRRYHVLSLEAFLRCRREDRLPPERSVVITFDDGYADNRAIAYPILRQYGFPATIFLVSQAVGTANLWDGDSELTGRPILSGSDIQEMTGNGIDFGAHTRHHVSLTSVPSDRVKDEVEGSRADLEYEVGSPIYTFAYPYGKNDLASRAVVERAGFLGACSFQSGVNDHTTSLYALHRTEIRGTDSLLRFALALWLGGTRLIPRPRGSRRGQP